MPFYKKKPVVIDANQWDGTVESANEIIKWAGLNGGQIWLQPVWRGPKKVEPNALIIRTLEGDMWGKPGDFIIKGVAGEFYSCDREIFHASYEPLVDSPSYS